ncbi:MAG: hypothetical protein HY043_01810 [Verrucomicrobia bacterium]|nr:hypothetical protein [Verrucomicrobiota bacterium]
MNIPELREQSAQKLLAAAEQSRQLTAFIGLDGFVDDIVHAVDKRENAESFERLPTIAAFAGRIAAAAGKSTNIEFVNQRTKLGGNGPILANALAQFGVQVTYLGALGFPNLHPVFSDFATRATVHSITEPGHTDAVEFEDGKVMLTKSAHLKEITWANVQARFGRAEFAAKFNSAQLVGFVNWTMIPYMTDLWAALQTELCPALSGARRTMFFDLADPEKRPHSDILRALELINGFEKYFFIIFGLNEKEAFEIGDVLGLNTTNRSADGLATLAQQIQQRLKIATLVVHPVSYALAVSNGAVVRVEGPRVAKPLITTGAGDHFNAGFCLGKLLGGDNAMSLLCGVTTSGFYVRTAQSPTLADLAGMLCKWPGASKAATANLKP